MNGGTTLDALARPEASPAAGAQDRILDGPCTYHRTAPVRWTRPAPDPIAVHLARYGPLPAALALDRSGFRDRLLDTLRAIGLSGRGGAHFSVATKWESALRNGGGGTVVGTGVEGEPVAAKDAALLTHRPHLVLDGLVCAARAIGAPDVVVYLRRDAPQVREAVERAIVERWQAGVADDPRIRIALGPHGYLTGESTAVLNALSGGPAIPRFGRELPTTIGLGGRPTIVHNVETAARIALAARRGSSGYRDTVLVTVLGPDRRVVVETPPTTTVAQAVALGLGTFPVPQAVLLGGYGGAWSPWTHVAGLPLDHHALRAAGSGLGAGVIAPLPAHACGLVETARVVDYLAGQSAGQCGPCVFGLPSTAALLGDLARASVTARSLRRLRRYADGPPGRGGCSHPDGVLRLVRSALATFAADVEAHAERGFCLHPGGPAVLPVPENGHLSESVSTPARAW